MSYTGSSLRAIAVDANEVWRVFGSNDTALEQHILEHNAEAFEDIPWPSNAKAPTRREGLAMFIAGEAIHGAWVDYNWSLLDFLFWLYGTPLPCVAFRQVTSFHKIAENLVKLGSRVDLNKLLSERPPEHIPTFVRYPGGPQPIEANAFLDAARTLEIHEDLAGLTLRSSSTNHDAWACLAEMRLWFAHAVGHGTGLSLFYR